MRRLIPLTLCAALALPGAALAAKAKISPTASALTAAGVTTVEAANPNGYVLRGTATVAVRGRTVARKTVRLPKRSVTELKIKLGSKAVAALTAAGGRATVTLKLRRAGRRAATTARRTLTIAAAAAPAAPQAPAAPTTSAANGTAPAAPASGRWVGRMGTEGAYDDFELTVENGQLQIATPPFVPVYCFENGGLRRSAVSLDIFDVPGPWAIGTDGSVAKQSISGNQLVHGGLRTITYKVTGTTQDAGRVSGTLGMSFFDSTYDIFSNTITFINCSGAQSFEAVPAG